MASPDFVAGDELGNAVRSSVESVADSVVRIRTIGSAGSDQLLVSSRVTTGVVISSQGEVVTSSFGFSGQPATILVEDAKGDQVAAKIVATDHLRKLVLLQCEPGQFRPANFATEHWPLVGAYSVAAGRLYPGKTPAASVGVISAVRRIHGIAIQTDAKVSPVNYGGPLLDLDGKVTGILVPLSPRDTGEGIDAGVEWYDSGIGFAIPSVDMLEAVDLLRSGKDRINGRLGVAFSTENPLAENVEVKVIHPSSPADEAGLEKGDIIVSANDIPCLRFGVLQSIIKSLYANDLLRLEVKRGDKLAKMELRLAEKLERLPRPFWGLIPIATVSVGDQPGISCVVLPETPASVAGLPEQMIITTWNGDAVKSIASFRKLLGATQIGVEAKIGFVTPSEKDNPQEVGVSAAERPMQLFTANDELIAAACEIDQATEWKRVEQDVEGGEGKVWFYAPISTETKGLGVVVLLSESQTAQEVVLRRWRDVCEQHKLIIAVPSNKEGQPIRREDTEALVAAVSGVAKGRDIDADRLVLVAGKAEAELGVELLLSSELRQFRAAVFVETWPRVTGIPAQTLGARLPSVLVLNGIVQSRTDQALRESAVKHISESGGSVVQSSVFGDVKAERTIADWAFSLKAR